MYSRVFPMADADRPATSGPLRWQYTAAGRVLTLIITITVCF